MLDKLQAITGLELAVMVGVGLLGLVGHFLFKIVELRKANHGITMRSYFVEHAYETAGSVVIVLLYIVHVILVSEELTQLALESILFSAYAVDSLANKFRSRGTQLQI